MPLVEQALASNAIRRVAAGLVAIGEVEYRRSVLVCSDRVVPDWPVRAADAIDAAAITAVLALDPELVLLGTGERLIFPPPRIVASFLTQGIGFEAMDNGAAARTYNVLAAEGRRVVAAFILDPDAP